MEEEEKHEPELPEKKKKKEKTPGGISMPLIIGAAGGIIVLIIASVIIGIVVAGKFFGPQAAQEEANSKDGKNKATANKEYKENPYEGEMPLSQLEGVMFMETGRITTNPKNGTSIYVVMNLGFEFKKMDEESKELAAIADKEGKVAIENPLVQKMMARIRSTINQMIASYTEAELQNMRPQMPDVLKKQLKPVFKDYELILGNVSIQEFIIQ